MLLLRPAVDDSIWRALYVHYSQIVLYAFADWYSGNYAGKLDASLETMKRLTRSHCIPLSPTSLSFSVFIVQKFIKLLFPYRTCFQARQISHKITPSLNYTPKIKFSEHETLCSQLVCYTTCRGRNNFIKLTNTLLHLLPYIITAYMVFSLTEAWHSGEQKAMFCTLFSQAT